MKPEDIEETRQNYYRCLQLLLTLPDLDVESVRIEKRNRYNPQSCKEYNIEVRYASHSLGKIINEMDKVVKTRLKKVENSRYLLDAPQCTLTIEMNKSNDEDDDENDW